MTQQFEIYQPLQAPATRVDEIDRGHAEAFLRDAHARGSIDAGTLYERLALVDGARDRGELNMALANLRPATSPRAALAPQTDGGTRFAAAMGHFSFFFLWVFGPLLMNRIAPKGSYARREAAKAFNFQVVALGLMVLLGIVLGDHFEFLKGIAAILWLVLTVKGGVRAAKGEDWQNPVTRVVRLKVLDEGHPRSAA